jgi:hypothetical protein
MSPSAPTICKARDFYDKVLGALGQKRLADLMTMARSGTGRPVFFVLKPANGAPASVGNGVTVSFEDLIAPRSMPSTPPRWPMAAPMKAPGPRGWAPSASAAYARDLDGNKLAAYCFKPAW